MQATLKVSQQKAIDILAKTYREYCIKEDANYDNLDLWNTYQQRAIAYQDALETLGVPYGDILAVKEEVDRVDWEECYEDGQVRYRPKYKGGPKRG